MDPMSLLSLGSAGVGLIGSLFGSREGPTQEYQDMMDFLRSEYTGAQGISPEILEQMRRRFKMGLSNEALAGASQLRQTVERTGAGGAAERAGEGRLQSAKLQALGQGFMQADIASEQIRQQQRNQALSAMARLAGMYPAQEETGDIFGQLLGLGIYGLQEYGMPGFGGGNEPGKSFYSEFGVKGNQYFDNTNYPDYSRMKFKTPLSDPGRMQYRRP